MRTKDDKFKQKALIKARELFLKYGYEKVSIRILSTHLDKSYTRVYSYFKNKDDLFNQAFNDVPLNLEGAKKNPLVFAMKLERSGKLREKLSKLPPEELVKLI